ncbi:MAG TPA: VOC family protein [bacterium]|jgi:catechol 2,3-dioxygenase-like lactoylglutathione lyase family enzyme
MADQKDLKMNIIEILHYTNDVEKSLEFYHGKLGWPIVWQSPGNMATIDAGGVYQLTIVATKWVDGWETGMPVPPPKLAFQSLDLNSDAEVLRERGLSDATVAGVPEEMLYTDLSGPEGIKIMIWQDATGNPATQVVEEYNAGRKPDPIYKRGECVFFVNDILSNKEFYTSKFGFGITEQHGDVFYGMAINDGPFFGIYDWTKWWDKPETDTPDARTRLFIECTDIEEEYSRIKDSGAAPGEFKKADDGLNWFSLDDPDGNTMTFWQFKS